MSFYNLLRIGTIILGIVVVVVAALFLHRAVKGKKAGKKKIVFNISATAITAVSLVIIMVANYFTNLYANSINSVMTVATAEKTDTDIGEWKDLAYRISDEGMVLMKNKDSALPLKSNAKVNLLGYYAYNPIYSGSGSGSVSAKDSIDIVSSLEKAGIEVNPALEKSGVYKPVEDDKGKDEKQVGFIQANLTLNEIGIESYSGDISFDSMADYSDTAIVVLGRSGAEGADLTSYAEGDYLALSKNEQDLLKNAREKFSKLIVIVDSANAMQMGWVDEYNVDAVVWAGLPGPYGFEALGQILNGSVNPSGKLPDTWVYDNDSNPVNENFGEQAADNAKDRYYVDYVEGIYVGYKWYETAYAEKAKITNTKTQEVFDYSDYDSIVAYPFGYGLSYTTFDQKITGGTLMDGTALDASGNYTVEVTVTNTGDVAGKTPVQLYVTVPYTEYDKQNHVEKSEVSLVNYGKTKTLEPGESEVVSIDVAMEDLASYDNTYANEDGSKGTYLLDEGEYVFSVRSDAHNMLDQVSTALDKQYFFTGDNKRSSDKVAAVNQYDTAARGEYLSRQDGFANYESAMNSVSTSIEDPEYATKENVYDASLDDVVTKKYVEGKDYAVKGDLTLDDLKGADYDDERWSELISQMTIDELLKLTGVTIYSSPAIESIAKQSTADSDGPLGISSMLRTDLVSVAFPCVPVLSATFNKDLAHEMGNCVADQAKLNKITAWYAPAMDTHRSAYSGRNFEYYSEDGTLAAYTATEEVAGAREKGLLVYIKHFFLNDQESKRAFVHTYSNEQAIREIYLKPFEHAVKDGNATGVMNSMNYIGDTYVGAHVGTLTNVLRNEWGFKGSVLTDMDEGGEFNKSYWSCIRAGVDIWLSMSGTKKEVKSDADIYYLQRAAHNQLYFLANGNTYEAKINNWTAWRTAIYVELGGLALVCVVAMVLRNKKDNEQEEK